MVTFDTNVVVRLLVEDDPQQSALALDAWREALPQGVFLPKLVLVEAVWVMREADTIAVPDFDIDLLGHSYFAQAEALLHDLFDLMRHNRPPAQRQRITPRQQAGEGYYELRR
jgi:predicted nucleic acid-binding protein